MEEINSFSVPEDIPWKLAATSQPLKLGEPTDSTISIFYHEPKLESLASEYPEDRLIYLKFTVTICPATTRRLVGDMAESFFRRGAIPIRHALFDIGITSSPPNIGGSKPYFHSATPLRRTMIESGVVGQQVAEDAKDSIAVGKSGTQFSQTISSYTPSGVAYEDSIQTTDHRELTNSEASTERKELLSHLTQVENVLTLLSAKHLGSPFLQFSLSPRPVASMLEGEPENDPESWYRALLKHRSSGIEGIQEFTAIAVVPKGEKFCIQTRLRRVSVLDIPPEKPQFGSESFFPSFSGYAYTRIRNYLNRTYPMGTPIDELDVDLWPQINNKYGEDAQSYIRPTVLFWMLGEFKSSSLINIHCVFMVQTTKGFNTPVRLSFYKNYNSVWRDMIKADYLDALAQSPLERGVIASLDSGLSTCIEAPASSLGAGSGTLEVIETNVTNDPPNIISFQPQNPVFETEPELRGYDATVSPVHAWDDLDNQLKSYISALNETPTTPLQLDNPKIVQLFLEGMATLNPDDSRNIPLEECASLFCLDKNIIKKAKSAGICDLQDLAAVIISETVTPGERCRQERKKNIIRKLKETPPSEKGVDVFDDEESIEIEDLQIPTSGLDVEKLRSDIGMALEESRKRSEYARVKKDK